MSDTYYNDISLQERWKHLQTIRDAEVKNFNCTECGCKLTKSRRYFCSGCGKVLCDKHSFSYVDGNNKSITKNSPEYCLSCYKKKYPNDWSLK